MKISFNEPNRYTRYTKNVLKFWVFLLKAGLPPSKNLGFICFRKKPLKIRKNAFSFTFYLFFCPDFLGKANFKIMTSSTGKQVVTLHIFPSISRSNRNQTMTFVQFIEYKVKNVFLQQSYRKWVREVSPRPSPSPYFLTTLIIGKIKSSSP